MQNTGPAKVFHMNQKYNVAERELEKQLITAFNDAGIVIRIEQRPVSPLAVGNAKSNPGIMLAVFREPVRTKDKEIRLATIPIARTADQLPHLLQKGILAHETEDYFLVHEATYKSRDVDRVLHKTIQDCHQT